MGSCDNCNGGCLPPDDGMHRKEEKTDNSLEWCCHLCGEGKEQYNRLFSEGDINICSDCIRELCLALDKGALDLDKNHNSCSFCSEPSSSENLIFPRDTFYHEEVYICLHCINRYKKILELAELEREKRMMSRIHYPDEVFDILSAYIIGQEQARKTVSTQLHLRELIISLNGVKMKDEDSMERSNVLLLGPTGCGKTLIAQTIRKKFNIPVHIADANSFSEAGYTGEDVYSMFTSLVEQANGNVEKAQHGVVFVDEVDKIALKSGDGGDVSRGPVQQALLAALQGEILLIPKGFDKEKSREKIFFDTSELLFIGSGSFSGIEEIIQKRIGDKTMGFGGTVLTRKELEGKNILTQVTRDDLLAFGLIPEFLGRFHRIIPLESLTIPQYLQIIKEPKNSLLWHWKKVFGAYIKTIEFDDDALELIAMDADMTKSGARALKEMFETLMEDTIFNIRKERSDVTGYRLTADSYRKGTLEKVVKKKCSGQCGEDCCQVTGGECCGGDGHDDIVIKKAGRR